MCPMQFSFKRVLLRVTEARDKVTVSLLTWSIHDGRLFWGVRGPLEVYRRRFLMRWQGSDLSGL